MNGDWEQLVLPLSRWKRLWTKRGNNSWHTVKNPERCNPSWHNVTRIQLWAYFCRKSSGGWSLRYYVRLFLVGSYSGGIMPNNINVWELFGWPTIVKPLGSPFSDQIWGWRFQWRVQRLALVCRPFPLWIVTPRCLHRQRSCILPVNVRGLSWMKWKLHHQNHGKSLAVNVVCILSASVWHAAISGIGWGVQFRLAAQQSILGGRRKQTGNNPFMSVFQLKDSFSLTVFLIVSFGWISRGNRGEKMCIRRCTAWLSSVVCVD